MTHPPICDWLSWRHDYPANDPAPSLRSGRVMRIDADGVVEWEQPTWGVVQCASSDTSVRVKCDGRRLYFCGNAGRFGNGDNVNGVSVIEAFELSTEIIARMFPQVRLWGVGAVFNGGSASEYGTKLTRIDLAANFETDSYAALSMAFGLRRIGQRRPELGKFGPTWGYGSKRGQYWKAKLYDKFAEVEGRRVPAVGETLARFELQMGSEYLRQNGLDTLREWSGDMSSVVYGKFSEQVFRDSVGVEDWSEIPPRIRHHAVLWRDGVDIRATVSQATYYRVRAKLMQFGVDIGVPCNVVALTQRVRTVEVRAVNNLRVAA